MEADRYNRFSEWRVNWCKNRKWNIEIRFCTFVRLDRYRRKCRRLLWLFSCICRRCKWRWLLWCYYRSICKWWCWKWCWKSICLLWLFNWIEFNARLDRYRRKCRRLLWHFSCICRRCKWRWLWWCYYRSI